MTKRRHHLSGPLIRNLAVNWSLALFTGWGLGKTHCIAAKDLLGRLPVNFGGLLLLHPPTNYGLVDTEDANLDDNWTRVEQQVAQLGVLARHAHRLLRPGDSVVFLSDDPRLSSCWELAAAQHSLIELGDLLVLWRSPSPHPYLHIRWHVKPGLRAPVSRSLTAGSNVLVADPVHDEDRKHPSQLPVELCRYLIRLCSQPRTMVIDPFVGSGSSAVAAEMEERPWLAGDVETSVVAAVAKRVSEVDLEELDLGELTPWAPHN